MDFDIELCARARVLSRAAALQRDIYVRRASASDVRAGEIIRGVPC
jgi:hypothetical protein